MLGNNEAALCLTNEPKHHKHKYKKKYAQNKNNSSENISPYFDY